MSPCPPAIITMVCPWLINHLSDPWNFNKSNGILLRSNWRKPYPKLYGSELLIIKGWSRRNLLPSGGGVINPVLALIIQVSEYHGLCPDHCCFTGSFRSWRATTSSSRRSSRNTARSITGRVVKAARARDGFGFSFGGPAPGDSQTLKITGMKLFNWVVGSYSLRPIDVYRSPAGTCSLLEASFVSWFYVVVLMLFGAVHWCLQMLSPNGLLGECPRMDRSPLLGQYLPCLVCLNWCGSWLLWTKLHSLALNTLIYMAQNIAYRFPRPELHSSILA